MPEIPKYYTVLFNAANDAVDSMEAQNFGTAKRVLLRGMYEAEGEFLVASEREAAAQKAEQDEGTEPEGGN